MPWDTNPIYAVLHESIYCQGAASAWAAHRVRGQHYAAEFDAEACARGGSPVMFTGALYKTARGVERVCSAVSGLTGAARGAQCTVCRQLRRACSRHMRGTGMDAVHALHYIVSQRVLQGCTPAHTAMHAPNRSLVPLKDARWIMGPALRSCSEPGMCGAMHVHR